MVWLNYSRNLATLISLQSQKPGLLMMNLPPEFYVLQKVINSCTALALIVKEVEREPFTKIALLPLAEMAAHNYHYSSTPNGALELVPNALK